MTSTADESAQKPPAEPKSVRTRRRIMDATARVLGRRGYAGSRLSDIADEAELQAASIYYHFSSREELIEEVVRDGVRGVKAHVEDALTGLPPGTSPLERISAAVEAHLTQCLKISPYTTAAIRNTGQLPGPMAERQRAAEAEYAVVWRDLLEDAHAAGVLRTDVDLTVTRLLVLGALNLAAEWWDPQRGSLEMVVSTAQKMVRNALDSGRPTDLVPVFRAPGG